MENNRPANGADDDDLFNELVKMASYRCSESETRIFAAIHLSSFRSWAPR